MNDIKVATGTITTSLETTVVDYSGRLISAYAKDASGNKCFVNVTIGSSTVTFTAAQNPSSALTCTVVYI